MSTIIIWIIAPMIMGSFLFFIVPRRNMVAIIATATAFILMIGAFTLTSDGVMILGPWRISLQNHLSITGLQLFLPGLNRSILVTLYGITTFIFGGTLAARVQGQFFPLGLLIVPLTIAAISSEPVAYGVFFFYLVVLLSIFILSPPDRGSSKGVLRFFEFQVFGLALILLAVWLLPENEVISDDLPVRMQAIMVMGLGFMFLFAIFPLYTWVTMISEETHPYAAMFVFSMIFGTYTFYFTKFLDTYGWLLGFVDVFQIVRLMGVFMVGTGGIWAFFQHDLGRLFGYAVVIEVGYSLLSIGLQNRELQEVMVAVKTVSLAVWALGLSVIKDRFEDFRFKTVQGMARRLPTASVSILIANLSLAGLPLLSGFPILLSIWKQLASVSTIQALWTFFGSVGLLAGGLRSMAVFVMGPQESHDEITENYDQRLYLIIGILSILLLGLFPHIIYPIFSAFTGTVPSLNP